jgi:hypothetical protein
MAVFMRTANNQADVEMMAAYHQTIAALLATPGLAGIISNLESAAFRTTLANNLNADCAGTLAQMGITLPVGGQVVFQTNDQSWRVEIQVPIAGRKMVFGLDSFTGYFDEFRAL